MDVDIRTLMIVQALSGLVQVAALYVHFRLNTIYRGQGWMVLGNGFLALGYLLMYMADGSGFGGRPVLGYDATFVIGMLFICVGILGFIGKQGPIRWLVVANVTAAAASACLGGIAHLRSVEDGLAAAAMSATSVLTAALLFQGKGRLYAISADFLAAVFLGYFLTFLERLASTLLPYLRNVGLFAPAPSHILFHYAALMLGPLSTLGFIIMVNQRLDGEHTEARERLELIFDISPEAVLVTRMEDGVCVSANEAFTGLTGYTRDEVTGKSLLDLRVWSGIGDRNRFVAELKKSGSCANMEFVFTKKDGSTLVGLVSARAFSMDGRPHILSVTHDISTRKMAEEEIGRLAHQLELERNFAQASAMTDGLTRLANRRRFDEALRGDFYRLKRSGAAMSLIMLDVDFFKKYNDTCGHLAGDDCLRGISEVMRKVVGRAADTVARYGGEEFAVVMPETDSEGAYVIAERIRKGVEELGIPHSVSEVSCNVTISAGIVTIAPLDVPSPEKVIELADIELYKAKKGGRNRIERSDYTGTREGTAGGLRSNPVKLVWSADDECGNALIDGEHRNLFDISNRFLDAAVGGGSKEELLGLFESYLEDVVVHFRHEDTLLRERQFPGADEHAERHVSLVARSAALKEKFRRDEASLGDLFSFFVYEVIAQHIMIEDRKFFPYVTEI